MKIYLATEMGGTPFAYSEQIRSLESNDITITDQISDASVIIAHNYKNLLPWVLRYPKKKYLVWTNEPRFDTSFKSVMKLPLGFSNIEIMNVYGKEVFWHNLHFLSTYHFNTEMDLGISINSSLPHITKEKLTALNKNNKIASFFTNTLSEKNKLIKQNKNIDLSNKRCQYALEGHKRNVLDIYGNKWPNGFAVDNSGYGFEKDQPWWTEKISILSKYKYNLCFENTAQPYYVTEKIWHSIYSLSLPIYNSFNSTIYETFPENSFLDANMFTDEHELFDYLKTKMSDDEYIERLNLCIDVFNKSIQTKKENWHLYANEQIVKIVEKLNCIVSANTQKVQL